VQALTLDIHHGQLSYPAYALALESNRTMNETAPNHQLKSPSHQWCPTSHKLFCGIFNVYHDTVTVTVVTTVTDTVTSPNVRGSVFITSSKMQTPVSYNVSLVSKAYCEANTMGPCPYLLDWWTLPKLSTAGILLVYTGKLYTVLYWRYILYYVLNKHQI